MKPSDLFDRLSDEELISVAKHHQEKFNRAWVVVMSSHHRSGRYIDAHDTMEREYGVLGAIAEYVRDSRPWPVHQAFLRLNTGHP